MLHRPGEIKTLHKSRIVHTLKIGGRNYIKIVVQNYHSTRSHRSTADLCCRFREAPFYANTNTSDFICSTPGYGGMTTCDEVPAYRLDGVECNETLRTLYGIDLWNYTSDFSLNSTTSQSSSSSTCINWNAYYTDCRPDSTNPFQGSISFDNIFLAWIAIFQVIRL